MALKDYTHNAMAQEVSEEQKQQSFLPPLLSQVQPLSQHPLQGSFRLHSSQLPTELHQPLQPLQHQHQPQPQAQQLPAFPQRYEVPRPPPAQVTLSSIMNTPPRSNAIPVQGVTLKTLRMRTKRHITQKPAGSEPSVEKELLGVKSIRTYYPTEEEFKDPYNYIAKLEEENKDFGAVKIVPPESYDPPFSLDLEKFKFRAVKQSLKHSTSNYNDKLKFYKDLIQFHEENGTPLVRLPSIDKRVVDLYKLRNSVRSKGGFDTVCQRKLWAQIGRELGYTGRIMTSLSSSLKLAYLKILNSYEQEIKKKAKTETANSPNIENKRPILHDDNNGIKKQKTGAETPLISNSKQLFGRPRDVLKSKGFRTNFESYTDERQGLTQADDTTYPYYDFHFWHKGIEAMDHPYPSSEATRIYNFQQFYDIHLRNSKTLLSLAEAGRHEEEYLTKEFWRIMDEKDHFNVETANYLPSDVFGTGFPTFTHGSNIANKEDVTHPWNLNNLPLNEKGILRYLSTDNDSITRPKLTASMLHSVSSWGTDDHFLYSADYLHAGFSKVWYFIPAKDRAKYEDLLAQKIKDHQSKLGNQQEIRDFAREALMTDIMDGLKQEDQIDKRLETINPKFNELYDHKLENNPRFNSDLFIPPDVLIEHGITIHHTVQSPGEFLIKFPESYSSMISMGGSLSESVNFAPISESWLQSGLASEDWLCKQGLLPNFSFFELLINVVEICKDPNVLKAIAPFFDKLTNEHLELRAEVKSKVQNLKVVNNKFDYISDDDLSCNFPSKVVVYNGEDDFSFSLKSFLARLDADSGFLSKFDSVELHVYFSDEKIKNLQRTMVVFAQTPEDWSLKFEELLSTNTKPSLKNLKSLYYESERIKGNIPEALTLKEYLDDANVWLESTQLLLNSKQKNRIRNKRNKRDASSGSSVEPSFQVETNVVKELVEEIPNLNFTCPEIGQLQELANEIYQFEISVRSFLTESADHTVDEFYDMIDLGKSFGVKLKSIDFLERLVARKEWLNDYQVIAKKEEDRIQFGDKVEKVSLNEFVEFLDRGYDVCGASDLPLIDGVKNKVLLGKFITKTIRDQLASDFNIVTVDELLECTKTVPIDEDIAQELVKLRSRQLETVEERASVESSIAKNKDELLKLREQSQKRINGTPDFEVELYEKLRSKFKGGAADVRPSYTVVKQLIETSKTEELESHVRAVETWLRKAKKLFGKSNAPFSVLTSHLQFLSERTRAAFSIDDNFESDADDNHIYCICRHAESGTMIACEKCNEWYHCKCLKIGRGKTKQVDNYICAVCDWRVELSRDYNRPKLEELGELVEEGTILDLKPDELHMVNDIYEDGVKFREFLNSTFDDDYTNAKKVRFYLRKLEGGSALLLKEYNHLRQVLHRLDPSSPEAPPIVSSSTKTKKKKREDTADSTQDNSMSEIDVKQGVKPEVKLENAVQNGILHDDQLTEPETEEANGSENSQSVKVKKEEPIDITEKQDGESPSLEPSEIATTANMIDAPETQETTNTSMEKSIEATKDLKVDGPIEEVTTPEPPKVSETTIEQPDLSSVDAQVALVLDEKKGVTQKSSVSSNTTVVDSQQSDVTPSTSEPVNSVKLRDTAASEGASPQPQAQDESNHLRIEEAVPKDRIVADS